MNVAYGDQMMVNRLKESFIFVAEMENIIVGFASFTPVNDERQSELTAIYLYPKNQGMGIGTTLLQKGIKALENVNGKTFYEAKGFKTIKEYDDNFDGHILKTVRMCLTV